MNLFKTWRSVDRIMRIQDFGLLVGILFICLALGLYFGVSLGSTYGDLSKIPYMQYSPLATGAIGFILAISSLISLWKAKK